MTEWVNNVVRFTPIGTDANSEDMKRIESIAHNGFSGFNKIIPQPNKLNVVIQGILKIDAFLIYGYNMYHGNLRKMIQYKDNLVNTFRYPIFENYITNDVSLLDFHINRIKKQYPIKEEYESDNLLGEMSKDITYITKSSFIDECHCLADLLVIAEIMQENTEKYFAVDLYHWRERFWGTKFNPKVTFSASNGQGVITYAFKTAWSCPNRIVERIIRTIKEEDLDVKMTWGYACENYIGSECGEYILDDNKEHRFITHEDDVDFALNIIGYCARYMF